MEHAVNKNQFKKKTHTHAHVHAHTSTHARAHALSLSRACACVCMYVWMCVHACPWNGGSICTHMYVRIPVILHLSGFLPTPSQHASDSWKRSYQFHHHQIIWRLSEFLLWNLSLPFSQSSDQENHQNLKHLKSVYTVTWTQNAVFVLR